MCAEPKTYHKLGQKTWLYKAQIMLLTGKIKRVGKKEESGIQGVIISYRNNINILTQLRNWLNKEFCCLKHGLFLFFKPWFQITDLF